MFAKPDKRPVDCTYQWNVGLGIPWEGRPPFGSADKATVVQLGKPIVGARFLEPASIAVAFVRLVLALVIA